MLGEFVDLTPDHDWKSVAPGRTPFPTLAFVPVDEHNAKLLISLVPSKLHDVTDRESLRALHRTVCTPFVSSPDQKVETTEFTLNDGLGLYGLLEDPALVGKPTKRGQYKVAVPIVVFLRPDVVFHATLFTDSITSSDVASALQIVKSAKLVDTRTSALAADGPPSVRGPDATLTLPPGTFRPTGAGRPDDHYFSYADDHDINLSGWLDAAENYSGFKSFWRHEKAAFEKGTGVKVREERIKKVGPWEVVSYTTKMEDLVQYHLRACRTESNTWADLHLSVVASRGTGADLEAVLQRVTLTGP